MEAEATYDYEAMEDDELTLKVGDVITDIKQKDDGWCEGVLRGRRGVFPDNFVKFRQLKAFLPPEIPKAVLPSDLPKAVIPEMRGMESKVKVRRAKVAYSYTAENPDELNLTPGQVVEVIAEEEAGWWKGSVGGKVGVFPSNFVEELADDVRPEPPRTDSKITPEPVKLPPVDTAKLPINTVPLPVNESKPPIAPQDTRTDETDMSSDAPKIGLKVMPSFDPSKIKLKPSGVLPPPPTTNADPKKPIKAPEKAKIIADHVATRPEEIDVKIGDIVDVIKKDSTPGFWEVRIGDKSGVIPESAAEMSTPGKKPLPKEPPKLPFKRDPPKPSVTVAEPESSTELTESFGVPPTVPLDTTALQTRPKPMGRPPSSAKLPGVDAPVESTPVVPWKEEMKKRKTPVPPPSAATTAAPVVVVPTASSVAASPSVPAGPSAPLKPKPPVGGKGDSKVPQPALSADKSTEQDKLQDKSVTSSPVPSDDALKDALEKIEKLSEAFEKFKAEMTDKFEKQRTLYRREMDTLTHDLDEERKKHAATQIEVDRLKKSVADIRDK